MGMLSNLKSTVANANAAAANASVLQAQYNAAWQTPAAVNTADPIYDPIDGISLERYAWLTAQLVKLNLPGIDAVTAWVESQGVRPGTWATVQTGWTSRMSQSMDVRTRYGMLYSQA